MGYSLLFPNSSRAYRISQIQFTALDMRSKLSVTQGSIGAKLFRDMKWKN
jgi:hypothetical protein